MIRYQLTIEGRTVSVILDADRDDEAATIRCEGASADVALVQSRLHVSHGLYGHLIDERTTAEHLDVAMRGPWLTPFHPRRI
jgi:hypothetical protein